MDTTKYTADWLQENIPYILCSDLSERAKVVERLNEMGFAARNEMKDDELVISIYENFGFDTFIFDDNDDTIDPIYADIFLAPPTTTHNPDIDLLDKLAMAALTGLLANQYAYQYSKEDQLGRSYEYAQVALQERKKYLTINTPDNG